jgi:hypothetical protein
LPGAGHCGEARQRTAIGIDKLREVITGADPEMRQIEEASFL